MFRFKTNEKITIEGKRIHSIKIKWSTDDTSSSLMKWCVAAFAIGYVASFAITTYCFK